MVVSKTVIRLSGLILVLACIASSGGFFMRTDGEKYSLPTVRGGTAEIAGTGLYSRDSVFSGAGFRGQDAVTLFLGLPFLVVSLLYYRKGSIRGGFLLLGALACFLYIYVTMALGAAYNIFFPLYVCLFSSALFAFMTLFESLKESFGGDKNTASLPAKGPAALMLAGGAVTLVVWAMPIVANLVSGAPVPYLDHYTTPVTFALDLAVIAPSAFIAGFLLMKRKPLGYLTASALLGILIMLFPVILLSTYFQHEAGIRFTPGEMIGPVAGFAVLGLFAVLSYASILKRIGNP